MLWCRDLKFSLVCPIALVPLSQVSVSILLWQVINHIALSIQEDCPSEITPQKSFDQTRSTKNMLSQRTSLTPLRLLLLLLLVVFALFLALSAQATIVQKLEIEELTRLSSDVFHGQIVSTKTDWNAERTRIYTTAQIRVFEAFKGVAKRGDTISVVQMGGEKDGVKLDYDGRPEFTTGESVVIFATRTRGNVLTVVGLKQGKMRVSGESVTRDFSGLTVVERSKSGKALQPVKTLTTRLTMDELRQRIARAR